MRSSPIAAFFGKLRTLLSRISIRLLAFNVLLVFIPAVGLQYFNIYEEKLLEAQERSMGQQGRLLATALSERGGLEAEEANHILIQLRQRTMARLRVVDQDRMLLADSSQMGPRRREGEAAPRPETDPRGSWLYRLGSFLFGVYSRLFEPERPAIQPAVASEDVYDPRQPFDGPEIRAALAGLSGAETRLTGEGRFLTLYVAFPIYDHDEIIGAVLVSQSTSRILQDLYEIRLVVFRVFVVSVAVAILLSLLTSTTIARPLRRLRREASAILDRRGKLTGRFRPFRRRDEIGDLSRALAELSRRLEQHLHFIESFAADVSHEFKNPLASIRTASDMLLETRDPAETQRFLRIIQTETARMEHLLSALRDITQIDAKLEEEDISKVNLGELLSGVVQGFRVRLDGERELTLEAPEEEVSVAASPERLVQVFENLLDNALSFSPPRGRVDIALRSDNGAAVIQVADQGPGIPEEHLERIFDRFFSYRPTDERSAGKHSGLGLAISKAIVEGYGGTLHARNNAEGGATFEVRLTPQRT